MGAYRVRLAEQNKSRVTAAQQMEALRSYRQAQQDREKLPAEMIAMRLEQEKQQESRSWQTHG